MRFVAFALSVVWASFPVVAESRFGRAVIKLAEPKQYEFFRLDDNNYPFLAKGLVSVTCMTYRGTKRYYVEVGVANRSTEPIMVVSNFVALTKPGYTIFQSDTIASAADVGTGASGTFAPSPPPPPTGSTTTYSGTAHTYGNATTVNGTAATTQDNSAAGWNALGNAIAARRFYKAQSRDESFALYLQTFAHERADLVIPPRKTTLYVFTFEQVKPKKAPFSINVNVAGEQFTFRYRE